MSRTIKSIMLIDDNKIDNFFHQRVIRKYDETIEVVIKESGQEALDYLVGKRERDPDIIFLDINMPGMNGWEFIEHYNKLDPRLHNSNIVVMLTTSINPDDTSAAAGHGVISEFRTKPLTVTMLEEVISKLSLSAQGNS